MGQEVTFGFSDTLLIVVIVAMVALVIAGLALLRRHIKGGQFTEKVNGEGRIAVVTGANSGIGKQLCRELANRHVKVYMVCRNLERGQQALEDLVSRYGCNPSKLVLMEGDLASFASIRHLVEELLKVENKLDILVNNAGLMFLPRFERTEDGYERTWQSNYLGHFLLTQLLLPLLEASDIGGRIINVSSLVQNIPDAIDFDMCNDEKHFEYLMKTYARSKLAQIMHVIALTERIRDLNPKSRVVINACNPGAVNTNIIRNLPDFIHFIRPLCTPINWFVLKTDKDGAQTPLYLALSNSIAGISGRYFSDCEEQPVERVNRLARDENACDQMYYASMEACGLTV